MYDIDEFIFANRVMSAAEIAALAASSHAADGPYGSGGCGNLKLASTGGGPTIGNFLYQLTVTSPYAGPFSINVGSSRAYLGAVPLPFDLALLFPSLGSCMVDSSMDLFSLGGAKPVGTGTIPLPIPNVPAIGGTTLYLQGPALGGGSPFEVSNAFSVGIGN